MDRPKRDDEFPWRRTLYKSKAQHERKMRFKSSFSTTSNLTTAKLPIPPAPLLIRTAQHKFFLDRFVLPIPIKDTICFNASLFAFFLFIIDLHPMQMRQAGVR